MGPARLRGFVFYPYHGGIARCAVCGRSTVCVLVLVLVLLALGSWTLVCVCVCVLCLCALCVGAAVPACVVGAVLCWLVYGVMVLGGMRYPSSSLSLPCVSFFFFVSCRW